MVLVEKKSLLDKVSAAYFKAFEPVGLVVNFALMFVVYFTVVGSVALLAKLAGKKFMRENHQGKSYWLEREPAPKDLKKYLKRSF